MLRIFSAWLMLFYLSFPLSTYAIDAGPSEQVRLSPLADIRVFNALVEAVHQSTVSAQTSGRITEINFDVDDYVKKDSVLLRLSDKEQKSRLSSAQSSMKEAQANAEQAEKEFIRIKSIYEKKLVAKPAMDQAVAADKAAAARLKAAAARVDEAREQWEQMVVRAPYSGIVVKRFVQMGETAQAGQALMTGISLDHLRAIVDLPQDVAVKAREQAQMFVLLPGRDRIPIAADNITVFPYADTQSHSFRARLVLPEGLPGLYPGMMVKVGVEIGRSEQLLVAASAVVLRSEVEAVYIQDASGKVLFRQVRIGNQYGDRIQILAGLREGDKVLLDPLKAVSVLKSQWSR